MTTLIYFGCVLYLIKKMFDGLSWVYKRHIRYLPARIESLLHANKRYDPVHFIAPKPHDFPQKYKRGTVVVSPFKRNSIGSTPYGEYVTVKIDGKDVLVCFEGGIYRPPFDSTHPELWKAIDAKLAERGVPSAEAVRQYLVARIPDRLKVWFDPNDQSLIERAGFSALPLDVYDALNHARDKLFGRLSKQPGFGEGHVSIQSPACFFDQYVIALVLQNMTDNLGRTVDVQWLPNPTGQMCPDIEFMTKKDTGAGT